MERVNDESGATPEQLSRAWTNTVDNREGLVVGWTSACDRVGVSVVSSGGEHFRAGRRPDETERVVDNVRRSEIRRFRRERLLLALVVLFGG